MRVWILIGERDGVPYEDPGAEECVSVHASQEGAQRACAAAITHIAERRRWYERVHTPGERLPDHLCAAPYAYDSYDVREVEVLP